MLRDYSSLSEEFIISYPERYYHDGILKYYPIIAADLDATNPEALIKFLYLCTPITAFEFDYLVISCANRQNLIFPNGLKVPMKFLNDIKAAIDMEDEEAMQQLSPPFPEEISQPFLNCFAQQYELFSPVPTGYEGIDSILELLWKFSRSSKELFSESNSDYLALIKKELEEIVFNSLKTFKNKIPDDDYTELFEICRGTFNGSSFDDIQLNNFNNKLISRALARSE